MNLTPDPRYRPRPAFVAEISAAVAEFEREVEHGWTVAESEWLLPVAA